MHNKKCVFGRAIRSFYMEKITVYNHNNSLCWSLAFAKAE
ncbi:hypothetical protein DDD_1726 [Nonlabens dokdonensis DSW-6]|uniref:Uncharacterized protein n=1 Tax=Nonlabens dokdonensis (strain DSM 17205 / KCTC 12402 / DSW-6) TaxID=592029 RepID=L7WDA0_NONDD|nr:hypothetical protein DDD_1726 [Nonlabens dokdonensis DSW-6]